MEIKKDTKVKVPYRPELGTGAVLEVAEAPGGEYQVDVVFEKDGKRFLETFPQSRVEPVSFFENKLKMFIQNQEGQIRSNYDGVINIRQKCVGIQAIN